MTLASCPPYIGVSSLLLRIMDMISTKTQQYTGKCNAVFGEMCILALLYHLYFVIILTPIFIFSHFSRKRSTFIYVSCVLKEHNTPIKCQTLQSRTIVVCGGVLAFSILLMLQILDKFQGDGVITQVIHSMCYSIFSTTDLDLTVLTSLKCLKAIWLS